MSPSIPIRERVRPFVESHVLTITPSLLLQGMFRLRETVGALYEFVGSNLESPKTPFYLYVAPPKQELKDKSLTMMKAGLAPAANVYFGSKNGESQLSKQCLGHLVTEQNHQRYLTFLSPFLIL